MEKLRLPGTRRICTAAAPAEPPARPFGLTTMPSIPTRCDSVRHVGCAVSGALSVTTAVEGAFSLVHGPDGCSHQFISLLHSLQMDQGRPGIPRVGSSRLSEREIIFGGIPALSRALDSVFRHHPSVIFIISSCIAETIGDDISEVVGDDPRVPVIPIPIGGFIGGGFASGVNEALIRLAARAPVPPREKSGVAVIGEKNLEFDADAQYLEVKRLMSLLGQSVTVRFVRSMPYESLVDLASARLAVLRDSSVQSAGKYLSDAFMVPSLPAFPTGLSGTRDFLEKAGNLLGCDGKAAAEKEHELQEEVLGSFRSLKGKKGRFGPIPHEALAFAKELANCSGIRIGGDGPVLSVPDPVPAGTAGVRRVLSHWRRIL